MRSPPRVDIPGIFLTKSPSGAVVGHMKSLSFPENGRIVYYFFDPARPDSNIPTTFLRSLLHQLLRPETILPTFQRDLESVFIGNMKNKEPDFQDLEELILHASDGLQKVFVVVDGIQDSIQPYFRDVIRFLKTWQQRFKSVRLFVSAQQGVNVSSQLGCVIPKIYLKGEKVDMDIRSSINHWVENYGDCFCSAFSPFELQSLKDTILSKADGM